MSIRGIVIIYLGYTVVSVAGLIMIKYASTDFGETLSSGVLDRTKLILFGLGVVLYGCSFMIWLMILRNLPLSTAFPVAIGLTLLFSTIAAFLILKESIGMLKVVGMFFIFFGIILIFRDSSSM